MEWRFCGGNFADKHRLIDSADAASEIRYVSFCYPTASSNGDGGDCLMATRQHRVRVPGLAVQPDLPLIGVVLVENGQEVVRYFANEAEADSVIASHRSADARSLAGAWADLDWEEAVDALDRIRHDSEPTPPITAI
jgi:hypothetical protein